MHLPLLLQRCTQFCGASQFQELNRHFLRPQHIQSAYFLHLCLPHTTQDHCHLCCLPLLTLHTILLALIGSDLATLASWLPGSKLKRSLFGGSPTVAQCLLLQTCKLPKTARTAQKCAGKAYSAQTGRPSVTLHMQEPSPSFLIKSTPPRLPIHLSS